MLKFRPGAAVSARRAPCFKADVSLWRGLRRKGGVTANGRRGRGGGAGAGRGGAGRNSCRRGGSAGVGGGRVLRVGAPRRDC